MTLELSLKAENDKAIHAALSPKYETKPIPEHNSFPTWAAEGKTSYRQYFYNWESIGAVLGVISLFGIYANIPIYMILGLIAFGIGLAGSIRGLDTKDINLTVTGFLTVLVSGSSFILASAIVIGFSAVVLTGALSLIGL